MTVRRQDRCRRFLDGRIATVEPRLLIVEDDEVRLSVAGLENGRLTVNIAGGPDTPTGRESRRAVAQIVLTATSLPEVEAVLLIHNRAPVEAPLPSGEQFGTAHRCRLHGRPGRPVLSRAKLKMP